MLDNMKTKIVFRNGIAFQMPLSIFSSRRYSVHMDGVGSGWTNIESLDVNQPIGLSYRQLNHLAIAVRKRVCKEHVAFADVTVGGDHLPGGCGVLGIVENTADLSVGAGDASIDVTEGKFIGRGIIYDQTNNALWCWTNTDGTTSADPYLLTFHPDRAWDGGDVTWAGAHQFDSSVCFSDGEITGAWLFEGTTDFQDEVDCSDVLVEGTFNVTGTFKCLKDITTTGMCASDGAQIALADCSSAAPYNTATSHIYEASTDLYVWWEVTTVLNDYLEVYLMDASDDAGTKTGKGYSIYAPGSAIIPKGKHYRFAWGTLAYSNNLTERFYLQAMGG